MALTITKVNLPAKQIPIKCPYPMNPTDVTVHNTSNDASAMAEISYMQGNPYYTSFHYAVDDTRAVQGLELNRNGFHAGDGVGLGTTYGNRVATGYGNRRTIGVEICYSKSGGSRFTKAEENGALLVAMILKSKGWGISRVRKHQDYWQGTYYKYCPHRTLDLGWQRFLNMVQAELDKLNGKTVQPPKTETKPSTGLAKNPKPLTDGNVGDTVKVYDALYANSEGAGRSINSRGKTGKIKRIVGNSKKYIIENWGWAHANDIQLVKRATVAKPSATSPKGAQQGTWIKQNGTFTLGQNLPLTADASGKGRLIANISKGQAIKYDAFMHSGGYVWIRQKRGNGYGYMATGYSKNGVRQDYWGTFK